MSCSAGSEAARFMSSTTSATANMTRTVRRAFCFSRTRGRPDPVSGENLGATLANHPTLRLATLNSCEGGRTATDDPFAGVATGLVERQIPAVIAMQFEITDRIASVFSEWLYESLAAGFPVDRALSQARLAIFNRRTGVEWGTPVLFMRVRDGRIFNVPEAPPVRTPTLPPQRPDKPVDTPPAPVDDKLVDGPPAPVDDDSNEQRKLPWWRRRIAAVVGAVVVALLAVAAGAYVLKDDNGTPPLPPQPDRWSTETSVDGMNQVQGIAADGPDGAFIVGANGGALAVQHYDYANGALSKESTSGSGTMRALAAFNGLVVAAGRVVDKSSNTGPGDNDAGIWKRETSGSWVLACREPCGDSAPNDAGQQILGLTASAMGTFVAVEGDQ